VAYNNEGLVSFWDLMRGEETSGYVAFDLLCLRGRDLRGLPLVERKKLLRRLIPAMTRTLCSVLTVQTRPGAVRGGLPARLGGGRSEAESGRV
jgi:ATP-dependent DNA ligase